MWKFGKVKLMQNKKEMHKNAPKFGFCIPLVIGFGIQIMNYIEPNTLKHVKGLTILIGNTIFAAYKKQDLPSEERKKWQAYEHAEMYYQ